MKECILDNANFEISKFKVFLLEYSKYPLFGKLDYTCEKKIFFDKDKLKKL